MQLITISGLDGSGKSTQFKKLQTWLENNGKKVSYFHVVQFSLANRLFSKVSSDSNQRSPSITTAGYFKVLLRKFFLLIDLWRFRRFWNNLQKKNKGDFLISDRYFYDQIINILYLEKKTVNTSSIAWWQKLAEKLLIRPHLAVFLTVNPIVAQQRKQDKQQNRLYFETKNNLYEKLSPRWQMLKLDGNQDKQAVFQDISSQVEKMLK